MDSFRQLPHDRNKVPRLPNEPECASRLVRGALLRAPNKRGQTPLNSGGLTPFVRGSKENRKIGICGSDLPFLELCLPFCPFEVVRITFVRIASRVLGVSRELMAVRSEVGEH